MVVLNYHACMAAGSSGVYNEPEASAQECLPISRNQPGKRNAVVQVLKEPERI